MKLTFLALLACLTATAAHAAEIPAPYIEPLAVGDSWSYKKTVTIGGNHTKSLVNYKITSQSGDKLIYQSMVAELTGYKAPSWRKIGEVDAGGCLIDVGGGGA